MLRCAPLVSPPFVSPRRNSRALSLFRRCAPYKSSHPDQSVADLTRPRRFLMKSSLTRSVAPLICQTGIMQTRLRAILFGAFAQSKLANMYTIGCVPPTQNHPKIFFSEVQAVLHLCSKNSSVPNPVCIIPVRHSAARKCEPFIRSSFFRSASKLSLFHSFPLAGLSVEF